MQTDLQKHVALLPPICSPDALAAAAGWGRPGLRSFGCVHWFAQPSAQCACPSNGSLEQFAPALAKAAPQLQIALIGGGTDRLAAGVPNVKGYGFVSSEVLQACSHRAFARSARWRGRGIKVKVLDAIAAGCPILRRKNRCGGLSNSGLPASISLSQPAQLASAIAQLASVPGNQAAARKLWAETWANFPDTQRAVGFQLVSGGLTSGLGTKRSCERVLRRRGASVA